MAANLITVQVTTNKQLREMNLGIYTLSRLALVLNCVNPCDCLEHRLTHPAFAHNNWEGELTLDALGNFVSFS